DCRLKLLPQIFKIQAKTNLNIFVTSRPTLDVEKEFQECSLYESLEICARDEDVEGYLESRVSELRVSISKDVWRKIKKAILVSVKGMYVWLKLSKILTCLC